MCIDICSHTNMIQYNEEKMPEQNEPRRETDEGDGGARGSEEGGGGGGDERGEGERRWQRCDTSLESVVDIGFDKGMAQRRARVRKGVGKRIDKDLEQAWA